jgi:hypothetical protein
VRNTIDGHLTIYRYRRLVDVGAHLDDDDEKETKTRICQQTEQELLIVDLLLDYLNGRYNPYLVH